MSRVPTINVTIEQGEDFSFPLQLLDADGAGEDVSSYSTWTVDVGTAPGGTRYGAGSVVVVDATTGQITIEIAAAVTSLMTASTAAFDVFATNPLGKRVPVARAPACPIKLKVPTS